MCGDIASAWDTPVAPPASPDLFDTILAKVGAACEASPEEIKGHGRTRRIYEARRIAMVLLRKLRGDSYPDLARAFEGRDHTCALNACRTFGELPDDAWQRATAERVETEIIILQLTRQLRLIRRGTLHKETQHAA